VSFSSGKTSAKEIDMFPYEFYKVVHFVGLFFMMMALGGISIHIVNGGSKAAFPGRRWASIFHGIGLFLVLLGGFGMYARLFGGQPFPAWIYTKLVVWLLLALAPLMVYRAKATARLVWLGIVGLATVAAMAAIYKF